MKKAQVHIMVFILLLALFIILYVLVLPPDMRDNLLNQSSTDTENNSTYQKNTVLSETPGLVFPLTQSTQTHNLFSLHLFIQDEPEVTHLSNSFTVTKNLFKNTQKTLKFNIEPGELYEQYLLVFDVENHKNNMIITLNDNIIFSGEATSLNLLSLDNTIMQEKNTLIFSSESSIFTSFYDIEYVNLKMNYETSHSEATTSIALTEDEKLNIASSELNFDIFCNKLKDTSTLKISLNNNKIFQEELTCKFTKQNVEIDKLDLNQGKNIFEFTIDNGDFNIENLVLENQLSKEQYKQYSFIISREDFALISGGKITANLELLLWETIKAADLYLNNYLITLDTEESVFNKDISNLVQEGLNTIEIIPKNYFEIRSLTIRLE